MSGSPSQHDPVTRRRAGAARLVLLLLLVSGFTSCYASNVVAAEDRDVKSREDEAVWRPAQAASIPGLYRSGTIEGASAASLLKLFYYFDEDGTYTAAALVSSSPPSFQVHEGEWSFAEGMLRLGGDSPPATLEEFEDMVRITTQQGKVVLYRDEIR